MMFQCTDMTVLERQRAGFNWQQQQYHFPLQQQNNYFGHDDHMTATALFHGQLQQPLGNDGGLLNEMVMKPDPGLVDNGVGFPGSCLDMNYYSNVSNSENLAGFGAGIPEQITSPGVGTQGSKKRKFDKGTADEKIMEKNSKEAEDRNSKVAAKNNNNSCSSNHKNSNSNKENSGETSKDNSKVTEVQKPDYIHVRARRGQATDSHSLAERVRREKISERMKYLQDLVPGCNKITGKAGMLDEIINYVQSLQRQVEFLSMKLATVNPRIDFNIDNLFVKEVLPVSSMNFPTSAISADTTNCSLFQFNPLQQTIPCGELDTWINHSDMRLKRTLSPPISLPETLLDTSCFTPSTNWDIDLQNLYNQTLDHGRSTSFPSQQFTGSLDG